MTDSPVVTAPSAPALDALCEHLTRLGPELDRSEDWPHQQLRLCGEAGVFQWFMPREWQGQEWGEVDVIRGYLRLGAACLTTAFIITQRTGAMLRIAGSDNQPLKEKLLPGLVSGETFATVGISHLTTSRRHLAKPVLQAEETADGFLLNGYSPWVTGAAHASVVVTGAVLDDGRQILVALPTDLPGVSVPPQARLVGLSGSKTGEVRLNNVELSRDYLLAGPVENVMQTGIGGRSGGLHTSTLAVALSAAAIDFLEHETLLRPELAGPTAELRRDHGQLENTLFQLAEGNPVCSNDQLRAQVNSLALRASHAALAAAKGAGYVVGHPAGRWSREALFFLVWSCPQGVLTANLCELAGLD